eukprot:2417962-Rhodomonas_salina.1
MLVPAAFRSPLELAVFCCAYPEQMPSSLIKDVFGDQMRMDAARQRWVNENKREMETADPDNGVINLPDRVTKNTKFTLSQFADWYVNALATTPSAGSFHPSASWGGGLQDANMLLELD